MTNPDDLQAVIDAIQATVKYSTVCTPLIQRIATTELAKYPKRKDAIKSTKNKLHQVAGAYLNAQMPYAAWLAQLRAAPDAAARRTVAQTIMASHASTRERLPILAEFYAEIFDIIGPVRSVLDVACGLNPLAAPQMPLPPAATYTAIDVFTDMMAFLGEALPIGGVNAVCLADDIVQTLPAGPFDVAFVLKTLPCLEQTDKSIGPTLFRRLQARWIVVSFPNQSLGGRTKGMAAHYDAHFTAMMEGLGVVEHRLTFDTELVYIVTVPIRG